MPAMPSDDEYRTKVDVAKTDKEIEITASWAGGGSGPRAQDVESRWRTSADDPGEKLNRVPTEDSRIKRDKDAKKDNAAARTRNTIHRNEVTACHSRASAAPGSDPSTLRRTMSHGLERSRFSKPPRRRPRVEVKEAALRRGHPSDALRFPSSPGCTSRHPQLSAGGCLYWSLADWRRRTRTTGDATQQI